MSGDGGVLATADYLFCDSDVIVDVAKGGGALVDAFLSFVGDRGRLVEDVFYELQRIRQWDAPWTMHLGRLLDEWSHGSAAEAIELTVEERMEIGLILDCSDDEASAEARTKDKGETATVVRVQRWIEEWPSNATVIAMTDGGGHNLAGPRHIKARTFAQLLDELVAGDFIADELRVHALAKKQQR